MSTTNKTPNTIKISNHFWDNSSGLPKSPVKTQNYTIIQVAESYYRNHFVTEGHLQCCDLEITYAMTNGLICSTDGVAEIVDKSQFYLSFKDDCHDLSSNHGCRFQTLAIDFNDGPCRDMLDELYKKFAGRRKSALLEIATALNAVIAEFLFLSNPFSVQHLDSLITSILVKLIRLDTQKPAFDIMTAEEKLAAMVNYIDLHFLEIGSLDEFSLRFGYTYSHICKMFKKQVGVAPKEYLLAKKMDHAAQLLADGKSVSKVADILGYSTPYNFSRAFKDQYGVSPKEYPGKNAAARPFTDL